MIAILFTLGSVCVAGSELIQDESVARSWLEEYNTQAEDVYYNYILHYWNYNTNLTSHNQKIALAGSLDKANFRLNAYKNASLFDWQNFQDEEIKRLFTKVSDIGTNILTGEDQERFNFLNSEMDMVYSKAKVCRSEDDCDSLDPELTETMANSRDWDELVWAWKGWRDASGKPMKDMYEEFMELQNKAAHKNDYEDAGAYWRSWYEDDDFESKCVDLWNQVKPLYQQLHGYVKRKLKERYSDQEFPSTGHIPAHILGNMWAQQWNNLADIVTPYPEYPQIDVTAALINQGYTAEKIFKTAEDFFTSLGLSPMPQEFWEHSMMVKPEDRDVVCHASAWDFYNRKDFRIKQCTEITGQWLVITHHEMGHIIYFLQYSNATMIDDRDGANPGFHEAVGDVLALSVSTPEHLKSIGLVDEISNDKEYDINYLMDQALQKIAFLPFGFLVDQWRWSIFSGETPADIYNQKWWQLRCQLQGISPPVQRYEDDFDAGSKFHVPSNTAYIRYFVSYIIQFQFHKALCDASGYSGPLHRCDIYNNTVAGKKLGDMLRLGSSKPWPDAMEAITGQRKMDASALMEFFKPLSDWLEEQNKGYDITWEDGCPKGMVASASFLKSSIAPLLIISLSLLL